MKALKSFLLIASVGVLFTFSNCGGDPKPSESDADKQLALLSKTWKLTSVTLKGSPVTTPSYTGFQLGITGTKGQTTFNYTTTFPGTRPLSPWKGSGTWEFGANTLTKIIRDKNITTDKLEMDYTVSATQLTISFNFTGSGYSSRVDVVEGDWVFTFGL
jgi:hypothetical protein